MTSEAEDPNSETSDPKRLLLFLTWMPEMEVRVRDEVLVAVDPAAAVRGSVSGLHRC